jgi:hypothetical protein
MATEPRQLPAVELAYRYILSENQTAVGVAFVELDCRCIKLCGITHNGDIVAPLTLVLGPSVGPENHPPVCPVCRKDGGVNPTRVVRHGLVWSDESHRTIDARLKREIGRRVFGSAFDAAS